MTDNQVIIDVQVDYGQAVRNLAELKAELDRLRTTEQALNAERKNGNITEEQWRIESTRNTEQQKRLRTEINRTSREVQQATRARTEEQRILQGTATAVDLATASYNELSRTYTRMKDRINEMSAAERQANQAYIQQSQQVYERMKTMQAETGKMQLNVGNYENAILSAVGANNTLAQSLLRGASSGQGFAGAMRVASTAVGNFGKACLALLTNPVFLVIAGIAAVGAAFKFWADYNDGIAEATRLTREFMAAQGTQATAQQIANMRAEIQAIADVYGKGYKETLQAVDTLMVQFGVDAATALDIIRKGFAAGADLNGDMLAQIEQYAPALRDAGVAADELVALIAQTRSGLFSKEGMDIIVKAGQNIRKMSKNTADALRGIGIDADEMSRKLSAGEMTMLQAIQQVSKAMQGVGDNTQAAGEVIVDVFGKKGTMAGQQQIEAIAGISTELDKVIEQTGEYGELQDQIVESQKELNQYTEALFGSGGWEKLKQQAEIYWNKGLAMVLKFIVWIINAFKGMYNSTLYVRGAIMGVVGAIKAVWNVFKGVADGIAKGLKGIGEMLEGIYHMDWARVSSAFNNVTQLAKDLGAGVSDAIVEGFREGMQGQLKDMAEYINVEDFTGDMPGVSATTNTSTNTNNNNTTTSGGRGGDKSAADKAAADAKRAAEQRKRLEEQLQKELTAMLIKNEKDRTAQINAEYDARIADIKAKYAELGEGNEKVQQLIAGVEAERTEALHQLGEEQIKAELEQRARLIQTQMETFQLVADNETLGANERTAAMTRAFNARLAALAIQQEQERRQYEGNAAMLAAIDAKYQQERATALQTYTQQVQTYNKEQVATQTAAMEAEAKGYSDTLGALSGILGEFGEESEEAAIASKVLAVAQVAIQQGVAIAKATAAGSDIPFPGNIAAIASGIAAVMASIMSAVKAINKAKFAEGGLVEGGGTETSDSIPAMLSRGESVINARSTRAFAPLLSAINVAGGGVPIAAAKAGGSVMGEAMLSKAFAAALREMPSPVVAVSEIERVGQRVKVIENFSQV